MMLAKYFKLLTLFCLYFQLNGQHLQAVSYLKSDHRKLTANGERYDMYGLTAGHNSLEFNTLVQIKHINNHGVVVVRINDRSQAGQILLSYAAAKILDLEKVNPTVKLKVVGKNRKPIRVFAVQQGDYSPQKRHYFKPIATYTPAGIRINLNGWGVQIEKSGDLKVILKKAQDIANLSFKNIFIQVGWSEKKLSYRLMLGSFTTYESAKPLLKLLTKAGFKPKIKPHL